MFNKKAQILGVPVILFAVLVLMTAPLAIRLATDDTFSVAHMLAPEVVAPLSTEITVEAKASMDFFIMSYCPYGRMYVQEVLPGLIEKYGPELDWTPRYIVTITGNAISAMHGQQEVDQNIREVCVREEFGKEAWYDYVSCFYASEKQEFCYDYANVDMNQVEDCLQNRGADYIAEDVALINEYGAGASPTTIINEGEKKIVGANVRGVNEAVELAMTGEIKQDAKVKLLVLTDSKCSVCNPSGMISTIRERLFNNLEVVTMDYQTPEGKEMFEELSLRMLPAYIFDDSMEASEKFAEAAQYCAQVGDKYILGVEGNYLPRREAIPGKVDLFVMAYCPFGRLAETSMDEVREALGDQIDLNIHYIASEKPDGSFDALHGQPEVEENIRQLCMFKYYPDQAHEYIACRNEVWSKETKGDWKECVAEPIPLAACAEGPEGAMLLSEDIKTAQELGFSGSPSFMINNQISFTGAKSPEDIKNIICEANDLEGCDVTLTSGAAPQGNC